MAEVTALTGVAQFGIVGMLFYMWWMERKDRIVSDAALTEQKADRKKLESLAEESNRLSASLISVIQANTKAITILTEQHREKASHG